MASASRRLKRKKDKKVKKDMAEKVALFHKIPDFCTMCENPFDKKDKSQVQSWRVIVREEEQRVNLYCPTCWDHANELLNSIMEDMEGLENAGDS
tara:strand:+ start:210 stop:494 length:285 start_codon:yes stop_codon:yes gene_type:complete